MQSHIICTLLIALLWVVAATAAAPGQVNSSLTTSGVHALQSRMLAAWSLASTKAQATARTLPHDMYPTFTAHNGPVWNTSEALAWTAG